MLASTPPRTGNRFRFHHGRNGPGPGRTATGAAANRARRFLDTEPHRQLPGRRRTGDGCTGSRRASPRCHGHHRREPDTVSDSTGDDRNGLDHRRRTGRTSTTAATAPPSAYQGPNDSPQRSDPNVVLRRRYAPPRPPPRTEPGASSIPDRTGSFWTSSTGDGRPETQSEPAMPRTPPPRTGNRFRFHHGRTGAGLVHH